MNIAQSSSLAAWLLAVLLGGIAPLAADEANDVDAGRQALHESGHYPWYDGDKDAIRRIPIHQDPDSTRTNAASTPSSSFGNGGDFSTANTVILFIAVIGLSLLIFVLVRSYLRRENYPAQTVQAARSIAAFDQARVEALPFDIHGGNGDLLSEVRKRIGQGDFAQAVVYLFSYQLLELDRHHLIRLAKGKTNRQYLREMSQRRRELRGFVEPTMVACEDVFFGNHPIERARFEACWNRLDEFGRLVAEVQ